MMKKIVSMAAILVIAMACSLFGAVDASAATETIPKNVFIDEIDVGGMTADSARAAVNQKQATAQGQQVIFTIEGSQYGVSMADFGYAYSNIDEVIERATSVQAKGNLIQIYKAQKDLEKNHLVLKLEATYDQNALQNFMNTAAAPHSSEVKNASVTRGGGTGFIVSPSSVGKSVDTAAALASAVEQLSTWDGSSVINVAAAVTEVQPTTSTADLDGFGARLGAFSASLASSDDARNKNLVIGCAKLNGTFIENGATFDLYSALGPFTTANGYLSGHGYSDGQIVDSIGGGVCQICTVLYVTSLKADMTIVQRNNHSMTVGYVPLAWDATIASGGGKTLKIQNNTGYPVYIAASASGGSVTVEIYGKETRPAGYEVVLTEQQLTTPTEPDPIISYDSSLPAGTQVITEEAHPTVTAQLTKSIYIGGVLQSSTVINRSSYRGYASRIRVGTGGAATPPPTAAPTTPPVVTETPTTVAPPVETPTTTPPAVTEAPTTVAPPPETPTTPPVETPTTTTTPAEGDSAGSPAGGEENPGSPAA